MDHNVIVLSKRDVCPPGYISFDTTSKNPDRGMKEGLSPFYLGPVHCYDELISNKMENAWQFSKVYLKHLDINNNPTSDYYKWRDTGFSKNYAERYPMQKGAIPAFSFWKVDGIYQKLDYIEARKLIYVPLYAKAVVETDAFCHLKKVLDNGGRLALRDFDGYNNATLGMTLSDVINCPSRKMGHAFVLKMLLDQEINVEAGNIIDFSGVLD